MTSQQQNGGPQPPYGAAIRDAIARGKLHELRELRDSVRPALAELEDAIKRLESQRPGGGARVPYGPPIQDAIASGDLQTMKATAEAVRRALFETEFDHVSDKDKEEVRKALNDLDTAIRKLDR